jgi:two-component system, cell cycle sensor histidine kinase and response regulator CckA
MQTSPERGDAPRGGGPLEPDYRRLFDLTLDLLCVAGIDGYFKRVNPSWTRVLGWSEHELLSRPIADFMHPEDRARTLEARARLRRGILVQGLENRYLCKDGSFRWLAWQSAIDSSGTTVYAVARDITERRKQEQDHLAFSKLECTGILAGGIAHDFNNLLATVRLTLDMVGLSGELNEPQKACVRQAVDAVESAKALTQQLITFAQGGTPARQTLDLRSLLYQSVELALAESPVRAECLFAPDLWLVEVDKTQIGEVIYGLVSNARESAPVSGTVRIEAENVVLGPAQGIELPPGDYVRIGVIDDGAGIAPEIMAKVFDPYFSTKQRGARKGMGMGLTVCRSIIQKHGGLIRIEPAPTRGTKVICYLPAKRTASSAA